MIKKIALYAVLILIFVPAFAMAAGHQGSGPQGSGSQGSGPGILAQQQTANQMQLSNQLQNSGEEFQNQICNQNNVMTQGQSQWGNGQIVNSQNLLLSNSGDHDRLRDRDRLKDGTGDGIPDRDQVRDRLKDGSTTDLLSISADQDQFRDRDRLKDGTGDGIPDRDQVRDRLKDGSCKDSL